VNNELKKLDDVTRRDFVSYAAKSFLGVSALPGFSAFGASQSADSGKAQHVIYLFMNGAMSHLDTFDPKPGVEEQGATKAIKTDVAGIQISEHFSELAKRMKHINIIRSMGQETGAHEQGRYLMRTGYKQIASTRHPSMGPWIQKLSGKMNDNLPSTVMVGNGTKHPGAGFLPATFSPVPIGNPAAGLQNTKSPGYVDDKQFNRRMSLTFGFDSSFRAKFKHRDVEAYTDLYREAIRLLKSTELEAFDINKEAKEMRDKYGNNTLGQGCLLARRLVENRVRFVEVDFGGWDNHRDIFTTINTKAQNLDQAVSALLDDLEGKGLLEKTLIVITTEFGRTPKINQNTGRDHHPGVFSSVLAGGGTKGGLVYGSSDRKGFGVEDDPVTVQDFNATIGKVVGLPVDEEIYSPAGRPFTVAHGGEVLEALL